LPSSPTCHSLSPSSTLSSPSLRRFPPPFSPSPCCLLSTPRITYHSKCFSFIHLKTDIIYRFHMSDSFSQNATVHREMFFKIINFEYWFCHLGSLLPFYHIKSIEIFGCSTFGIGKDVH